MNYPQPRPPTNIPVIVAITVAIVAIFGGVAVALTLNRAADPPSAASPAAKPLVPTSSPAPAKEVRFEVVGHGVTVAEIRWQVGYDQSATDEDARLPWGHKVTPSEHGSALPSTPVMVQVRGDRNQQLTCRIRFGDKVVEEKTSDRSVTCSGMI